MKEFREYSPLTEVKKRAYQEKMNSSKYNQFVIIMANYGLYYRTPLPESPGSIPFVGDLRNAAVFDTWDQADMIANGLREAHGNTKDFIITIHDPRLDIETR